MIKSRHRWIVATSLILLCIGVGLMFASGWMVSQIDRASIPDAVEMGGPDELSMFHGIALAIITLFLLTTSGLLEVGATLIFKRGPLFSRFLAIFSIMIFALGCLSVWEWWDTWREAKRYVTARANENRLPAAQPLIKNLGASPEIFVKTTQDLVISYAVARHFHPYATGVPRTIHRCYS